MPARDPNFQKDYGHGGHQFSDHSYTTSHYVVHGTIEVKFFFFGISAGHCISGSCRTWRLLRIMAGKSQSEYLIGVMDETRGCESEVVIVCCC